MKQGAQQKKITKKKFPLGIFLMLFIVQSLIASAGVVFYYYKTGLTKIQDMEKYRKSFSITLADAFAEVAELSHRSANYSKLKSLFKEKIGENIIDEAFFVLKNGTLIVHSNKNIEKSLHGNIANDEFSYNIDMILLPLKKKTREVIFTPYNIIGKIVPFNRQEKDLIKQYVYKDINTLGWLVTRGVYSGKKPLGTVNFLIYNEKIFDYIGEQIEKAKQSLIYSTAGAFVLSLIISLIVLIRYRSIQKKTISLALSEDIDFPVTKVKKSDKGLKVVPLHAKVVRGDDVITIDLDESMSSEPASSMSSSETETGEMPAITAQKIKTFSFTRRSEEPVLDMGKEVKDAIPVMRKR
ncbi:MAG TPA: hypothetical protein PK926_13905 [Spirochaetota bacterium]|nr:hypothetical protein [Spirochaetota bacterium]HPI88669.1 hypothetical protein [Spirochaetota bacterium]HPR49110.1 hypothetical protein [Spirochaetota bacterium]